MFPYPASRQPEPEVNFQYFQYSLPVLRVTEFEMAFQWRHLGEVLICGFVLDACIYAGFYLWPMVSGIFDRRRRPIVIQGGLPEASMNERVMFFPEEKTPCRQHYEEFDGEGKSGCPRNSLECPFSHEAPQLEILLKALIKVKSSLDVCVYMISSYELGKAIIDVHKRGVRVRVVVDGTCPDEARSKVGHFRAEAIPVRSNKPPFLMHHKFLVLDDQLLINGSFNWTWQAIVGNHENLMMTENPALVKSYSEEFNRLWNNFDPVQQ